MAAYFENGVFTDNEPAWHGLGIVTPETHLTRERIFELVPEIASPVVQSVNIIAQYEVDDEQAMGLLATAETNGWHANIRQLDGKILGFVGKRYEVIQNDELFALGDEIIGMGGQYKTAGTLHGGATVWGLIEIPEAAKIAGEEYRRFLLLTNSHDGTSAMRVVICDVRVVCANTLAMGLGRALRGFSIKHTLNARDRACEAAEALKLSGVYHQMLADLGNELAKHPVTKKNATDLFARLIPYTPKAEESDVVKRHIDEKRDDLQHVWLASPNLENIRNTAWGTVHAVAEWEQHYYKPDSNGPSKKKAEGQLAAIIEGRQPHTSRMLEIAKDYAGVGA